MSVLIQARTPTPISVANGGTASTTVSGARQVLEYSRNALAATLEVASNTTLTSTNLVATLGVGTYRVRFVGFTHADSGTPGAKYDVALSSGSTTTEHATYWNSGGGATSFSSGRAAHHPLGANGPISLTESRDSVITATITITTVAPTTVTLRLAQNTSSADKLYLQAGSYVEVDPFDGTL